MIVRPISEENAIAAIEEAVCTNAQDWEFVDGAYVHGIMDGEARKNMTDREFEGIRFYWVDGESPYDYNTMIG